MRYPSHPLLLLSLALAVPGCGPSEVPVQALAQETAPQAQSTPRPAQPDPKGSAKEVETSYEKRFQELDRNRDGSISLAEWPLEPESFRVVDRNEDGRLSRRELLTPNTLRRDPFEERFQVLDANRDGRLDRDELQRDRSLERGDRNRDGILDRREYGNWAQQVERTWNPRASVQDQRRFRVLDRNQDQRLSLLEWSGSSTNFNRLDRNRDGALSPNEWQ